MNITAYIKDKIARIDAGDAFTYDDLAIPEGEFTAASKSLSRLVTAGTIKRFRKGVYYRPKQTDFGELRPRDSSCFFYVSRNLQACNLCFRHFGTGRNGFPFFDQRRFKNGFARNFRFYRRALWNQNTYWNFER